MVRIWEKCSILPFPNVFRLKCPLLKDNTKNAPYCPFQTGFWKNAPCRGSSLSLMTFPNPWKGQDFCLKKWGSNLLSGSTTDNKHIVDRYGSQIFECESHRRHKRCGRVHLDNRGNPSRRHGHGWADWWTCAGVNRLASCCNRQNPGNLCRNRNLNQDAMKFGYERQSDIKDFSWSHQWKSTQFFSVKRQSNN